MAKRLSWSGISFLSPLTSTVANNYTYWIDIRRKGSKGLTFWITPKSGEAVILAVACRTPDYPMIRFEFTRLMVKPRDNPRSFLYSSAQTCSDTCSPMPARSLGGQPSDSAKPLAGNPPLEWVTWCLNAAFGRGPTITT